MITDIQKLDTGLLSSQALQDLQSLLPSIRHDWEVKPIFRTETEARLCVLNDIHHPTPHAKYWQSVREQQVHFNELVYLALDYKRKRIELEILVVDHDRESKWWKLNSTPLIRWNMRKANLIAIDLEQKRYEIELCDKVARERMRELKQWDKIKTELLSIPNHGIDIDDSEGRNHLKSHAVRFIKEWLNSGNITDAGSAQNVLGKAKTAIRHCREAGFLDEVMLEAGITEYHLNVLGA